MTLIDWFADYDFFTFSFSTFSCASVPVSVKERRRRREGEPLIIFAIFQYFQWEYPDFCFAIFLTRISGRLYLGRNLLFTDLVWRKTEKAMLCKKPPVQNLSLPPPLLLCCYTVCILMNLTNRHTLHCVFLCISRGCQMQTKREDHHWGNAVLMYSQSRKSTTPMCKPYWL